MPFFAQATCDLSEEVLEEIRMNTNFKRDEIVHYRKKFLHYTNKIIDMSFLDEEKKGEENDDDGDAKNDTDDKDKNADKDKDKAKDKKSETSDDTDADKDKDDKKSEEVNPKDELPAVKEEAGKPVKASQVAPATTTAKPTQPQPSTKTVITSFPMTISKLQFLNISSIAMNPIKDRLAFLFDFKVDDYLSTITFHEYMQHTSSFNSPGNREMKLRLAFKIQDFNGDEKIDRADLTAYFNLISRNGNMETVVGKKEMKEVINKILNEASSDPRHKFLTFEDFQRVMAATDFDTNLKLAL